MNEKIYSIALGYMGNGKYAVTIYSYELDAEGNKINESSSGNVNKTIAEATEIITNFLPKTE